MRLNSEIVMNKKILGKLAKYSGFEDELYELWASQFVGFEKTCDKIIDHINIIESRHIRKNIITYLAKNKKLFSSKNTYILKLGDESDGSNIIAYELAHTAKYLKNKIISIDKLTKLPEGANLIFIDDIAGTGNNVINKLNEILPFTMPSYNIYVFLIASTVDAADNIKTSLSVKVNLSCCVLLTEEKYCYFSDKNTTFDFEEKIFLFDLCEKLDKSDYWKYGLLIGFHYRIPNNTMPIIWKHKFNYYTNDEMKKEWTALLPRDYC